MSVCDRTTSSRKDKMGTDRTVCVVLVATSRSQSEPVLRSGLCAPQQHSFQATRRCAWVAEGAQHVSRRERCRQMQTSGLRFGSVSVLSREAEPNRGSLQEQQLPPLGPAPLWGLGCCPCQLQWVHPKQITDIVCLMEHWWALPRRMELPIPHCPFTSWDRVGRAHQHYPVASERNAQHTWCFHVGIRCNGKGSCREYRCHESNSNLDVTCWTQHDVRSRLPQKLAIERCVQPGADFFCPKH